MSIETVLNAINVTRRSGNSSALAEICRTNPKAILIVLDLRTAKNISSVYGISNVHPIWWLERHSNKWDSSNIILFDNSVIHNVMSDYLVHRDRLLGTAVEYRSEETYIFPYTRTQLLLQEEPNDIS